jgi:hypothetical protein
LVAQDDGQTPGVERKPPVPSGVGKFAQEVAVGDPAAEEAARDAVERWMETFTPGEPTADAAGILSMRFLENQGQAIVDGTMFIPPPLSVEGLAGEALMRDGSGSLQVQQAILELVGNRRQELVESVAAKLLALERCAAAAYAFQASGIASNMKSVLTELLIGGTLPEGLMTYLADFIQTGGTYDILMNPAGWLMSELGSLVTQDAINTYIVIWLTNQLIGAQMFAQMAGNEDLNDEINTKSEALLESIQKQSFFDQLGAISEHIKNLFRDSAASLVAAVAVGFNAPEMLIQEITTAGEERIDAMSRLPQRIMAEAAQDALGKAARAKDRRSRALQTAQTYGDAAEAARLALRAPVAAAGLSDFGMELLSQIGGATAQLLRSTLVLAGMRQPQPTDVIVRMNNNIADLLIGRYLGYIQQMGYAIVRPSQPEPVPPRVRLTKRQSEKIIDEIEREERKGTDAAAMIVGLIDRRVAEINPAAAAEPCPRPRSLSELPAAAAAAAPRMDLSGKKREAAAAAAAEEQMDEEETEEYQSDMEQSEDEEDDTEEYPSDESFESATEGSQSGGRKRKRHSTRSSTSSKSSKSGTRKHGKAKSKRVKRDAVKMRHMRLVPGAGHRTRKHSKRGRK